MSQIRPRRRRARTALGKVLRGSHGAEAYVVTGAMRHRHPAWAGGCGARWGTPRPGGVGPASALSSQSGHSAPPSSTTQRKRGRLGRGRQGRLAEGGERLVAGQPLDACALPLPEGRPDPVDQSGVVPGCPTASSPSRRRRRGTTMARPIRSTRDDRGGVRPALPPANVRPRARPPRRGARRRRARSGPGGPRRSAGRRVPSRPRRAAGRGCRSGRPAGPA